MEVCEIVEEYLRKNKCDGLWNPETECGCEVDDLAPCGEGYFNCVAGYRQPCDCGEGCDFHTGPPIDENEEEE